MIAIYQGANHTNLGLNIVQQLHGVLQLGGGKHKPLTFLLYTIKNRIASQ